MILMFILFISSVFWGICEYSKDHDKSDIWFSVFVGAMLAVCMLMIGGILTGTNQNEFFSYTPTEMELTSIADKYLALDGEKIYYITDECIRSITTSYAFIKLDEIPHAIYYKYNGFNGENWWRWIYTFPNGKDYVEFYVPDNSISTKYHFENI